MDFIVFSAAFVVFIVGLALAGQGFIGKELPSEPAPLVRRFSLTRTVPPPEKHPVRLMLIGVAMMVAAVAFVAIAQ